MNRLSNRPKMIKCPRCGLKTTEGTLVCADCGLKFERLSLATNTDAKRKKFRGDREFIINVTKLPSDVSFVKLIIYAIIFGMVGGHCYYVGRYLKGAMYSLNFIALFCFAIFNGFFRTLWKGVFLDIFMPICGFILLAWAWDIISIFVHKFKVPVAIDLNVGEV